MIAKTHLTIDWSNHKVFNEEDSFDSTSEEEDPFINPLQINPQKIQMIKSLQNNNQNLKPILSSFQFFKELQNNLQLEIYDKLLEQLKYQFIQQHETIFKYGDISDKFYFIISGVCVAIIPGKQKHFQELNILINQILSLHPNFILAKTMKKGKYFGEVGLKHNVRRKATVVAVEDSHLVYCDINTYKTILSQYFQDISKQKIQFFLQTPLFFQFQTPDIAGILIEAKRKIFRFGQKIYTENDHPRRVYFLVSGQVQLKKQFDHQEVGIVNFCEKQLFGEIEFVKKMKRIGSATVVSSKVVVYSLRYQKMIDNIFQYNIIKKIEQNAIKLFNHYKNQMELIEKLIQIKKDEEQNKGMRNFPVKQQSESQINYLQDPLKLFKKVVVTKKILTPLEKEEIKKKNMNYLKQGQKKNLNLEIQKAIKNYKSFDIQFAKGAYTERLKTDQSYDIKFPIISHQQQLLKKISKSKNYPYLSEF